MKTVHDLRAAVRQAYTAAAEQPTGKHPFPIGRDFARSVGYPSDLLDALPASAVDAFAGVSNVAVFADIPEAATVLDLGCGAGLDALVASRRTGSLGTVYGVDFSDAMLERAQMAADEAGADNITFRQSGAESLPLPDDSIDVALVNGIFNLNPQRGALFKELSRVMRPGGTVFGAELILVAPMPEAERASLSNWFA